MMRNLFTTKTAGAILGFAIAIIAPALPAIQRELTSHFVRNAPESRQADINGLISVLGVMVGTGLGLAARYSQGGVYTPKFLPGVDKPE